MFKYLIVLAFLVAATTLESTGDAFVRIGLFERIGMPRAGFLAAGAALLFGYGIFLNLAPLEFHRVVGLYIATLFIVWQVVSFFSFKATPSFPILLGGALIVAGGLVVSFWPASHTG